MVLQSSEQERSPVVQNELEHKLKQKISTWGVAMKRLGFTRKKLKFVALQRSDVLRAEYQAEVSMYNSSLLLLILLLSYSSSFQ